MIINTMTDRRVASRSEELQRFYDILKLYFHGFVDVDKIKSKFHSLSFDDKVEEILSVARCDNNYLHSILTMEEMKEILSALPDDGSERILDVYAITKCEKIADSLRSDLNDKSSDTYGSVAWFYAVYKVYESGILDEQRVIDAYSEIKTDADKVWAYGFLSGGFKIDDSFRETVRQSMIPHLDALSLEEASDCAFSLSDRILTREEIAVYVNRYLETLK